MITSFQEQIIHNCLVPSFTLAKGEIVVIQILGGALFYPVESALIELLTGRAYDGHIDKLSPTSFVARPTEHVFRKRFFPMSIRSYHNRHANKTNPIYQKIFDLPLAMPKTKVKRLSFYAAKLLSLYTTLSWTDNIITDLTGIGPKDGQDIYRLLKAIAKAGGAVILIDSCDEFKNDCTTFIYAKYLG